MTDTTLHCADCGTVLGTVDIESAALNAPVQLLDGDRLVFSSWEVGASVQVHCPDCNGGE